MVRLVSKTRRGPTLLPMLPWHPLSLLEPAPRARVTIPSNWNTCRRHLRKSAPNSPRTAPAVAPCSRIVIRSPLTLSQRFLSPLFPLLPGSRPALPIRRRVPMRRTPRTHNPTTTSLNLIRSVRPTLSISTTRRAASSLGRAVGVRSPTRRRTRTRGASAGNAASVQRFSSLSSLSLSASASGSRIERRTPRTT